MLDRYVQMLDPLCDLKIGITDVQFYLFIIIIIINF